MSCRCPGQGTGCRSHQGDLQTILLRELPLAGIGSRFLALGIDTLLQSILYVLGGIGYVLLPAGASGLRFSMSVGAALAVLFFFCVYGDTFHFLKWFGGDRLRESAMSVLRVIKESGRPIDSAHQVSSNGFDGIDRPPGFLDHPNTDIALSRSLSPPNHFKKCKVSPRCTQKKNKTARAAPTGVENLSPEAPAGSGTNPIPPDIRGWIAVTVDAQGKEPAADPRQGQLQAVC